MSKTTIPVNTNMSLVIDTSGNIPQMLYTPANITNLTFTFLVGLAEDAVNQPLEDGHNIPVSVSFSAGSAVPLDAAIFASVRYFKIVGAIPEVGSDKTIGISFVKG